MTAGVFCPSCGRPMHCARTLTHEADDDENVNVYECVFCKVNFITEDHLPIAGRVAPPN